MFSQYYSRKQLNKKKSLHCFQRDWVSRWALTECHGTALTSHPEGLACIFSPLTPNLIFFLFWSLPVCFYPRLTGTFLTGGMVFGCISTFSQSKYDRTKPHFFYLQFLVGYVWSCSHCEVSPSCQLAFLSPCFSQYQAGWKTAKRNSVCTVMEC